MTAPDRSADRPIRDAEEDRLGLGAFVDGLARSLLADDGRRARGVVIGLEGPWGSGKSSILNLVERTLFRLAKEKGGPRPTVVRFDPWLVSGREDLLRAFGRDLLAELDPASRRIEAERELVMRLGEFIERLAPAAGAVAPGAGAAIGGGLRALLGLRRPSPSLDELRRRVRDALDRAAWPIVVLIDELDRVEDAEVRTMAQLVRSVMDFPSISYLLAYDPQRVAEALGGGATAEARRRGEAYLEKIVQLRVPVPAPSPGKLLELLEEDVRELLRDTPIARHIDRNRLRFVLDLAGGSGASGEPLIGTLRDVRRVLGVFAALEPMLRYEIDPVDLLGWSILLAKRPADVERLKANLSMLCAAVHDRDGEALVRLVADPIQFKVRLPTNERDTTQALLAEVHTLCRSLVWDCPTPAALFRIRPDPPPNALCWQHRLLVAATRCSPPPLVAVETVRDALSSQEKLTQALAEASRSGSRLGFFIALGIARCYD